MNLWVLQNHKKTHSHLPITKHLSNNIQMDELWHLIKQNKTKTEIKLRKSTRKIKRNIYTQQYNRFSWRPKIFKKHTLENLLIIIITMRLNAFSKCFRWILRFFTVYVYEWVQYVLCARLIARFIDMHHCILSMSTHCIFQWKQHKLQQRKMILNYRNRASLWLNRHSHIHSVCHLPIVKCT